MPLFNIVIKMKEGKIYDIVWDSSCSGCKKRNCKIFESFSIVNNSHKFDLKNCFFENNKCSDDPSSTICDPKFYITWFGTDKKKRQLQTSSLAMSKFKRYSTSSLFNSILDIFHKSNEFMKNKFIGISSAIDRIFNNL